MTKSFVVCEISQIHVLRSEIRAACAQSFASWQQATIEIMRCNLSYYCLLALHI